MSKWDREYEEWTEAELREEWSEAQGYPDRGVGNCIIKILDSRIKWLEDAMIPERWRKLKG